MKFSVEEQEVMEEKETGAQSRIYIGGLGESVAAEDLRKILSAVGDVGDVDIIRTKGRSFAYVNFRPSSLNSIPKLFSMYNGCVWKGGRLRLEKAKEHYLDRLKREREEAAQPVSESGNREGALAEPSEKQLRIFFPMLRKAKSLPLSGTGKHKYSFLRVEPPPLPRHFCDCQEHFGLSDTAVGKQTDHQEENEVIIDIAEINIMNSVMKRLFERERITHDTGGHGSYNSIQKQALEHKDDVGSTESNMLSAGESRAASSGSNRNKRLLGAQSYDKGSIQLASETLKNDVPSPCKKKKLHVGEQILNEGKGVSHHDDVSKEESEKSEVEEDGLVLNVLFAAKNRVGLPRSTEKDPASLNLELGQDVHKERAKNVLHPKKKKSLIHDGRHGSEFLSVPSGSKGDTENHDSGRAQFLKDLDISRSWSQKSSWRALVGDKSNSAFSLSSILLNSDANKGREDLSNNLEAGKDVNMKGILSPLTEMEPFAEEVLKKSFPSANKKRKSPKDGSHGNETMSPRKKENSDDHLHGFDATSVAEHSGSAFDPRESNSQTLLYQESSWGKYNNILNQSSSLPIDNPTCEGETLFSDLKPKNSIDSELTEAKSTKPTEPSGEYGRGSSWLHQSSWLQLVSENTTFSLSEILPGSSAAQELPKPKYDDVSKSRDGSNSIVSKSRDGSNSIETNLGNKNSGDACSADGFIRDLNSMQAIPEMDEQTTAAHNQFSAPILEKKIGSETNKASARDSCSGETCLFMRSAASVKEWVKFKAALRGSNKKRNREKQAS